jgi:hypothetical protein
MDLLRREVEANFDQFTSRWKGNMTDVTAELDKSRDKYLRSYTRLVSLQAWRSHLEARISDDSLAFFLEAQNDALVSHVLARLGSWRSALKSIRSCIENIMFCLFYMDHPVELQLWHQGVHKLGFSEMASYLDRHPGVKVLDVDLTGLPQLRDEYATLSKAVHASAKGFRMTADARYTLLWSDARSSLGAWSTREQKVITGLNLLLLGLFREHLQGTSLPSLRRAVSLSIPTTMYTRIKSELGVTLSR